MSILWFLNDIPIHEYFHWFCVLQSKRKESKILILLQSTSSCLTASLSVNMEKSGSADMLITTTHRQGSISHRYGHIHTVYLWERVGECKGISSKSQRRECLRKYSLCPKPKTAALLPSQTESAFIWRKLVSERLPRNHDIMFNNQKLI